MARRALQIVVRTYEAEPVRHRAMIEDRVIPIVHVMAFETIRWKTATRMLVFIVGLVTGEAVVLARGAKQRIEARRRRMTGRAGQRHMRTHKGKPVGNRCVFEVGILPVVRVVAIDAGGGKARAGVCVVVIRLVTGLAIVLVRRLEQRIEARRWCMA